MTKTYKIGNTEIDEYGINYVDHEYIKFKFNELLEALSDKEECNHNWVGFSAMECSRCGKRDEEPKEEDYTKDCLCDTEYFCLLHKKQGKPKQEECLGCEANKEVPEWKDAIKHTCKPKQEECGACEYEEKYDRKITPSRHTCTPKQEECLKCNQYPFVEHTHPKQSTSLKDVSCKCCKNCI